MDFVLSIIIVIGALAASAWLGAIAVPALFRRVEKRPGDSVAVPAGILRGGMWIGVLERLIITGAVIAGFPEAVAVVIAVKGLGRYPELRETDPSQRGAAAERFILGTLASFLIAGLLAVLALWLLGKVNG